MDQAYRLKPVQFRGAECQILMQNENGPCPLLAAANALLLQGKVKLPPACVRNNVASLSDLTNVLANFALQAAPAQESQFYLDELLQQIPKLQDGMDVNPKFTLGIVGYEFTKELTCFDLWHVKLVHGWLLDPTEASEELFEVIGNKTYNELIELIIHGREAEEKQNDIKSRLEELRQKPTDLLDDDQASPNQVAELEEQLEALQKDAMRASYIDHFLQTTGHQLTQFGLSALHEGLKENELTVFFRNNHFATLTKHEGHLFLLVTDLGYSNTPMVVWERLDVIDGDTEYVNSEFKAPGQITQTGSSLTPEQLLAQAGQNDADFQLALQLSKQPSDVDVNQRSESLMDREEGKLIAAATEASLQEYHKQSSDSQPLPQQQASTDLANTSTTVSTLGNDKVEVGVPVQVNPPSKEFSARVDPVQSASKSEVPPVSHVTSQEAADALLAQQLANELSQHGQQQISHDEDWMLARQLQDEEEQRASAHRQATTRPPQPQQQQQRQQQQTTNATSSSTESSSRGGRNQQDSSKCIIS